MKPNAVSLLAWAIEGCKDGRQVLIRAIVRVPVSTEWSRQSLLWASRKFHFPTAEQIRNKRAEESRHVRS